MNDQHHQQQRMLPPGWVEATDPNSGRIYYANVDTHETRWNPPPPGYDVTATGTTSSSGGSGGGGGGGQGVQSSSREFPTTSSRSPSVEQQQYMGGTTTTTRRRTGNPLYSAVDNLAYDNPAKLVVMTRNMLDKAAAFPEQTTKSDLELYSITPGQIADLCRLQQQSSDMASRSVIDGGGIVGGTGGGISLGVGQQIVQQQQQQQNEGKKILAYTPINPYTMTTSTKAQITEKARLDVRIHSLKQKLVQFGGRNPEL